MSNHFLHWTADGRWIVFDYPHRKLFDYDPRGGTGITAADVGGTHLRTIVEDANPGNLFNHGFYADVSPDNNRLAYASCQFPNTTSTYTRRRSPEVRIPNEDDIYERGRYQYEIAVVSLGGGVNRSA